MLMWSTHLHSAALLDAWIGPKPIVVDYVRRQLLQEKEKDAIQESIGRKLKGEGLPNNLYDVWFLYTGLDFKKKEPDLMEAVENNRLLWAFFDLLLGQRVKAYRLCRYAEIYAARALIENFILDFGSRMMEPMEPEFLWWDGIDNNGAPPEPWISVKLRDDGDFLLVFERWRKDSEHLQTWLDTFGADTLLVNNPDSEDRVFSETNAIEILKWAEVRHLNIGWLMQLSDVFTSSIRVRFSTRGGGRRLNIS